MLIINDKKALSMIQLPENEHLKIEGVYYYHSKGNLQKLKTDLEVINPFHEVVFELDGEPMTVLELINE